jgi:hypothetical protein
MDVVRAGKKGTYLNMLEKCHIYLISKPTYMPVHALRHWGAKFEQNDIKCRPSAAILRLRKWIPVSKLFYRETSVRSWSMAPNTRDTLYILLLNMHKIYLNSKLFRPNNAQDYTIIRYKDLGESSIAMMALCGWCIPLNLHEKMN